MIGNRIAELRRQNGMSQEELVDRLGISRQSVSKWESGQSQPEIEKLLQLSELFHVSTDYLLKEDTMPEVIDVTPVQEQTAETEPEEAETVYKDPMEEWKETLKKTFRTETNEEGYYILRAEETEGFLQAREQKGNYISRGTAECVLSVVPVILGGTLSEQYADVIAPLGVGVMFAMIALAVSQFMKASGIGKEYEFLNHTPFLPEYSIEDKIIAESRHLKETGKNDITTAVVLFIVSVIPVILMGMMVGNHDFLAGLSVSVMFVLVAEGVRRCVRGAFRIGTGKRLMQEEEFKVSSKRNLDFRSLYWALITAAYFIYSAVTQKWSYSWIIWILAGIAYPFIEKMGKNTDS